MRTYLIGAMLSLAILPAKTITAGQPKTSPAKGSLTQSLARSDAQLKFLTPYLDEYPPHVRGAKERKQIETKLHDLIGELKALLKENHGSAEVEWRVGKAYRFAHNLDWKGAWQSCESHSKRALQLDPKNVRAYLSLGDLYVKTDMSRAPTAERLFRKALDLSGDKPLPEAHRGLFYAYYFQGRMQEALEEADKYLAIDPKNAKMKELREYAKRNLQR